MQAEKQDVPNNKVPPMAEAPKVETKKAENKEETRDEKKKRLQALPEHKLTKKDKESLEAILKEEAAEKHHGALIHKLAEAADKFGRKEIGSIKVEVTRRVGLFGKDESMKIKKVNDSRKGRKDEAHKRAKDEMSRIQRELDSELKKIDKACDEAASEIHKAFRPQYEEAEQEMQTRTDQIMDLVGHYTQTIQTLDTEQLEVLSKEGVVEVVNEDGKKEYLVRPDSPPDGK
jgi:vacuolar-type H+-ATPase subunit H